MMRRAIVIMVLLLTALPALAIDQAMPRHGAAGSTHIEHEGAEPAIFGSARPREDRKEFRAALNLQAFERLAIQHEDQVKIIRSWASQTIRTLSHRGSIDGQDPVYTALDMCFRPEYWFDQNIIYIQAVPLRQQLGNLVDDPAERDRILYQATVSPRFMYREDVQRKLSDIANSDGRLVDAVNKLQGAFFAFDGLADSLKVLAPQQADAPWHAVIPDLVANVPEFKMLALSTPSMGITKDSQPVAGYSAETSRKILLSMQELVQAWRENDAAKVNPSLATLADVLPKTQATYPSEARRTLELWYTRTFSGTLVGIVYFAAMVLFLLAAAGAAAKARPWAMGFFTAALVCHIAAMGVRWYLAGRIPIQNQFESVLGAALLGCMVGWVLEAWKRNGLFGMAMSFVGFVAMTACLVVPFVYGKSIGENVSPVAGILMTFWLYIHVNIVICSYALIAASFALGAVYLGFRLWHWINPALMPDGSLGPAAPTREAVDRLLADRREALDAFDAANAIIMRLAFLFLGAGIVFGAVWADQSWGRPWGWDPKETFALVTWLVYLILVHVRFAAPSTKGTWTAGLSVAGFAIMLFNWIGVNFFLVGLHSYA